MVTIDDSNYELWLLRYAEQELTAEERKTVEAWLAEHSEAVMELTLYNEAPRLQRDESIKYHSHTKPLWPVLLHWSAAAAVVAALIIPVTLIKQETGVMVPLVPHVSQVAQVRRTDTFVPVADTAIVISNNAKPIKSRETIHKDVQLTADLVEDNAEAVEHTDKIEIQESVVAPEVIYTDNLIVYESAPDTVYTNNLIVYDDSRRSWTEDVKAWAAETNFAQWVRRRFMAREAELVAVNE